MCGIVGLFLKDKALEDDLGALLTDMLITMTDRGPDSAGIAVYRESTPDRIKVTLQSDTPDEAFADLGEKLENAIGASPVVEIRGDHAVLNAPAGAEASIVSAVRKEMPELRIVSLGESVEIYKGTGLPKDVASRFAVNAMGGTHGVGHTRMATESAVTTLGAHPFSTGSDQCLVHNGSLSNHNRLRRKLQREGVLFNTENDSEVAAAYLTHEMDRGKNLGEALKSSLDDLDGFFTFVVGTRDGFGVLRDPIACKPAVMAETDRYVAFGSEYRALVNLPGIEEARVWEPEPATVYFWER
ncbi:MAG: glutamine amidotransferase family protein [Pseudomonadota bacterium]